MKKRPHAVLHRTSLFALAALTACAIVPLQPDLGAKAPVLDGLGHSDTPVTTRSDTARRLYHAGMLQACAFNEKEAVRQFKAALAAARSMAGRARRDAVWSEYYRSLPLLTLQRLERWDALLGEPLATGGRGMAAAIGQQARGEALVRRGRLPEARSALQAAEAGAAALRAAHASASKDDLGIRNVADAMLARLRAELAAAEHLADEALAQQARAVVAANDADDEEPQGLAAGARLALGDLQLQLGRAADAEAPFRADLAARPDSGWALSGLARAFAAQGKAAEAAAVRARGERAWSQADAALRARG